MWNTVERMFEQAPNRGRAIQESSLEGSALHNNAVKIYLYQESDQLLKTRRVTSPESERVKRIRYEAGRFNQGVYTPDREKKPALEGNSCALN